MWQGPEAIRFERFKQRHHPVLVLAAFGFFSGGVSIGLLALAPHIAHSPLVFSSLGPTAVLWFYHPLEQVAPPRNTVLGHTVGAVAGWVSLVVFGLAGMSSTGLAQIGWQRLGAAALSTRLTIVSMELCFSWHWIPGNGAVEAFVDT
jgi:CBS domain-containing membrane protein